VTEGVKAVVLFEDDGTEAAYPEVFVDGIGEGVPVVAAVSFEALVKFGVGVAVHGETSLNAGDEEGGVVEGVLAGDEELLLRRHGRQLGVGGDGAEVWYDAEDSLGLLRAVGADDVGVSGFDGLLRGGRLRGLWVEHCAGRVWQICSGDGRWSGGV